MKSSKKFILLGDGRQAELHRHAIHEIGGELIYVYDPPKYGDAHEALLAALEKADWVSIASPSYLHYQHIRMVARYGVDMIVEKPISLPWEPIPDSDRINVVLQFRYLEDLPEKANKVSVVMIRDFDYLHSWRGSFVHTGGLFYHLFSHYIDLAIRYKAKFDGLVAPDGAQRRKVDDYDLSRVDMKGLYVKMYNAIVLEGRGIKPCDIFYLEWEMRKSDLITTNRFLFNRQIVLDDWREW